MNILMNYHHAMTASDASWMTPAENRENISVCRQIKRLGKERVDFLFLLKGRQESWHKFYYKTQGEKTKTNNNRWPPKAARKDRQVWLIIWNAIWLAPTSESMRIKVHFRPSNKEERKKRKNLFHSLDLFHSYCPLAANEVHQLYKEINCKNKQSYIRKSIKRMI